ncbi:MAG: protein phosphatase 2C domain-containing protein [Bryobacteraceae bacterium]
MKIYVDVFRTQKAGNTKSEYEDAHWPPVAATTLEANKARIAVADGATDAVYSGLWARLLVRAYGRQQLAYKSMEAAVLKAAQVWQRVIRNRSLPWYAEEKARSGSFAALVGLELIQPDSRVGGCWSVLACGDSCFFQMRSDKLIQAFPVSRSEDFSNTPMLLGSQKQSTGLGAIRSTTGYWEEGDCFYLMTDALACWFLGRCETGFVPWQDLRDLTLARQPPFEEWISHLRNRGEIKNDDCTLISVSFEHAAERPVRGYAVA